ncbi:tetratricopeptide repeat protein [bacterium]|jgi:hypothetical protein|nr:tetratricopeptide repeat protein [bacterium]
MADIFDEINEDLKKDRAQVLWARYGKFVIAAVAAVILAVGSTQAFRAWKSQQAETSANAFHAALNADDVALALEGALGSLSDGYAMLARFQIAAEKAEAGDKSAAEADYIALSQDKSVQPLYQQAAVLMAVMNAPDGTDATALQARLDPLTATTGPWQGLAMEVSAALDLRSGNSAAALAKANAILALPEISPELRQRTNQLLTVLQ